ncbi:MAG: hypothetical protein R2854_29570 [Caldilineaceae bacterium]
MPAGDGAAAEGGAEKTTIEFWFEPPSGGGESAACILTAVIDPFNAQSDTVFVNAVPQPQTWDSARTAIAGGGGPDIIGTPGPSFVYELAQAGRLAPLDGFVDQYAWTEHFVPWALQPGQRRRRALASLTSWKRWCSTTTRRCSNRTAGHRRPPWTNWSNSPRLSMPPA